MKFKLYGTIELIEKLFRKESRYSAERLYEKAMVLFEKGKTGDGYTYLQASALKGHAEAAFHLALAISQEKTFGSMEDAVKYYTIASEKDHALATTNLATCYQLGIGVDIDHDKAFFLLNKAIKLGDDMATFNLAQTYLLGVGVKQDEKKGWSMLESLVSKGNKQAIDYVQDMLSKGYNPPKKEHTYPESEKEAGYKLPDNFQEDNAPNCKIKNPQIQSLYEKAQTGDKSVIDELLDLGGNQMNRDAMNALRKLGIIKEDISDDFKRGTIEYIAKVWRTYNVEPLYMICAWTYPEFIYREYLNGKIKFETNSEDEFIKIITEELSRCRKEKITPKFRVRKVEELSGYCIDVLLEGVSVSSFYLYIENGHYKGIYRVYDDSVLDI